MAITHPTDISGCQLCCTIDSLAGTADGTAIAQWNDESGNARHLTASGSGQPTYRTNQVNGWPALDFDGTDDFFAAPDFMSGFTAAEVLVLVQLDAESPPLAKSGLWRCNDVTGIQYYPYTGGNIYETWGSNAQVNVGNPYRPLASLQRYGLSVTSGANGFGAYFGSRKYMSATVTPTFGTTVWLGRNRDNNYLDGKILAFVVFNRVLTPTERRDLNDWAFRYHRAPGASYQNYWTALLALSPAMLWKMNESGGTQATDATGNARHGTYANAPTLAQDSLIPSLDDTSVGFNGSDEYITLADAAWMQPGDSKTFSAIFAYMPRSFAAQRDICGKKEMWQVWQETTGKITLYVTPAWTALGSDVALDLNQPHLIMVRKDGTGGQIAVLIDGQFDKGAAHTGSLADNALDLLFAVSSTANRYMNCRGQGFAYLPNVAVTDAQFADLYAYFLGEATPDPVAVTPGRIESSSALYGPTLAVSTAVQPARIEQAETLPTPTLLAAAATVQPPRVESGAALHAPSVVAQVVAVQPARMESASWLGEPEVLAPVSVQPARIGSSSLLYEPWVIEAPIPNYDYEFQADFQSLNATLLGTSITRRPDAVSLDYLTAFCPGPIALQDTSAGLVNRPWRARYAAAEGMVYLAHDDGADGWDVEVPLEAVKTGILEMDVAFTQNADPTIAAECDDGHIWIYWFDPLMSAFVWKDCGPGRTPRCILDDVRTITGLSDVQVFYVSDADSSVMQRQQRDRYDTPYAVPIPTTANTYLEDVVTGRDRRLHIVYSTRDPIAGRYRLDRLTSHPFPLVLDPEGVQVTGSVQSGVLQLVYINATAEPGSISVSGSIRSGTLTPVLLEYPLQGDLSVSPSATALAVTEILLEGFTDPGSLQLTASVPAGSLTLVVFERVLDRADFAIAGSISGGSLQ